MVSYFEMAMELRRQEQERLAALDAQRSYGTERSRGGRWPWRR
ncbi:MAG: hypothetical protein ACREQM_03665 [Candidatus Dormibacteraceae bacterium]